MFGLVFTGFLLGDSLSILFLKLFSSQAWRAVFISGSVVAFIGYLIRKKLYKTKLFESLETKETFPFKTLITEEPIKLIGAILLVSVVSFNGVMISLYIPKYIIPISNISFSFKENTLLFSAILNIFLIFMAGTLSDKINYKKLFAYSFIALIILVYPAMLGITGYNKYFFFLGLNCLTFFCALASGAFLKILCDIFDTGVRYSGVAMGYNLSFAILGGLGPLVAQALLQDKGAIFSITTIACFCSFLSLIALVLIRKSPMKERRQPRSFN